MKSIFASKTFWFNILVAVVAAVANYQGYPAGPNAVLLVTVANIALRFLTGSRVSVTGR